MSIPSVYFRMIGVIRRGFAVCLLVTVCSAAMGAETLQWDRKNNRVSANFRDWPLEKVLKNIAYYSKWDVKIPEDVDVKISGTFQSLPPHKALQHMFGHLNYAVFRHHQKGGKPRLQFFLPEIPTEEKAPTKTPSNTKKPATTTRPNPFRSNSAATKKPSYQDVMKRFDTNGDGLISNAERDAARAALTGKK